MYGYFINTSVAFPFSHQKSIIKSNFFDPLYFRIRHKKVNENLAILSKLTLLAFSHTFSLFMLLILWHYKTDTTQYILLVTLNYSDENVLFNYFGKSTNWLEK